MNTIPPPPRLPTIPGPPRVPSLMPPRMPSMVPPPPAVIAELTDWDDDARDAPPSGRASTYPSVRPSTYPSAPPSTRGDASTSRPSSPPPSRRSTPPRRSVPPAVFGVVAAAMMPACAVATRSEPPPAVQGTPLTLVQLDVTEGSLEQGGRGGLHIGAPKVRAVAAVPVGDAAELKFVYRGPSAVQVPLDSGEERQQLGLKLRAEDGCNVLYVMWRVQPTSEITVMVKRNPDAHTHRECGANGYRSIDAQWAAKAPRLEPGDAHVLSAFIEDGMLFVTIDGKVVWQGEPGADALSLRGSVGIRTDNVELDGVALVPGKR